MKFPINVSKFFGNSKSAYKSELTRTFALVGVLCSILSLLLVRKIFITNLNWNPVLVYLVAGSIILFILFYFIDVYVFKFEEKRNEYTQEMQDKFERYVSLKKDSETKVLLNDNNISMFEYTNGSIFCVMRLKFGDNNKTIMSYTKQFYEKVMNIALSNSITLNIIVGKENFSKSLEYKKHLDTVNASKGKTIRISSRLILKELVSSVEKNNNTDIVYFTFQTSGYYYKDNLEEVIKEILVLVNKERLAFREVKFLDLKELLDFYVQFYTIDAIDLNLITLREASEDLKTLYSTIVALYAVQTKGDEYFFNKENNIDIQNIILKERNIN